MVTTLKSLTPNALTLLRVAFALSYPFIDRNFQTSWIAAAAITEVLDGYLSRLWQVESQFGKILDPIADKLFVGIVLIHSYFTGLISLPAIGLLSLREAVILIGITYALIHRRSDIYRKMYPHISGKLATFFQFFWVFVTVGGFWEDTNGLLYVAASCNCWAALQYMRIYFEEQL